LCCHDDSFAAGFLESVVQATVDNCTVALICHDVCYPEPLNSVRPIGSPFAVAMVFSPFKSPRSIAEIMVTLAEQPSTISVAPGDLEDLRQNVPAARSLPLLAMISAREAGEVVLSYLGDMALVLHVTPR
ncbi:MAG: hypothetical protein POH28_08460, partial [Acidocella sp.]|nr:hypothetical protein [Acidocella sp.]